MESMILHFSFFFHPFNLCRYCHCTNNPWKNEVWSDKCLQILFENERACTVEFFEMTMPHLNLKTDDERTNMNLSNIIRFMNDEKKEKKEKMRIIKETTKEDMKAIKEEIRKIKHDTREEIKTINSKMDELLSILKNDLPDKKDAPLQQHV